MTTGAIVDAGRRPARRIRRWDPKRMAVVLIMFAGIIGFWQLFVTVIYDGVIPLPTPGSTVQAFLDMLGSGELLEATRESFEVLLVGGIPGVVVGIFLGLLIGAVRPLDVMFTPYIFAFYATPFPALIPIFLLLFGYFLLGKAVIVFTLVLTTMLLQTVAGVKSVDPRFIEAARSFGASSRRMLFEIQLPAAMTFIVAGMRLAVGRALVGVVIAEFDSALSGLGALIFRYSGRLRLSEAFVPAIVLGATGIILSILLRRVETRLERWRQVG
jgi:NitT/TauT family transport system permease protein